MFFLYMDIFSLKIFTTFHNYLDNPKLKMTGMNSIIPVCCLLFDEVGPLSKSNDRNVVLRFAATVGVV